MSDIVLVYPRTGMDISSTCAPPHNLLCVAAPLLKAGYSVRIIDQRVDPFWDNHLVEELLQRPVFVGISAMTGTQIKYALQVAGIVRIHWSTPIVWGGPHPTLLPEQVLATGLADYVCKGEVDETIVQIARDIEHKKAKKIIESTLPDVEKLLPEPYELLDIEKYIHPDIYLKNSPRTADVGQSSRGCPFACQFCSSASIRERKWRGMSSGKSYQMIAKAVKDYKLSGVWLRDDEFYINQQRAAEIAESLVPLKIRWYTSGTRVDVFNKTPEGIVDLYRQSGAHT
ncbi:MAG: cobalamin-dependent protein, partial [Alphaproteobacteria bacterium]|nr:cobalamin-dependent protein [Alphaproteobacteria bacterium]